MDLIKPYLGKGTADKAPGKIGKLKLAISGGYDNHAETDSIIETDYDGR